ncbi:chain-length determining protein [Zhengella mangrovi]|uniref:Chain-length determining protein n=1 Tax=Zhengella mangrovi TaxID=1982044 RepID=A0A2G1QMV5_9HYPH|nr:Wzz/FepE/Etk N-terminal domain-containing protein [Zhengella mangrovi]PHP66877.1 chain-length determining protein [Zhengella mangrovi]
MSGVNGTAQDVDIDFPALVAGLWRRKGRILLVALAATAAALAVTMVLSPKYMAETRILIETRESVYTRPNLQPGEDKSLDQESVQSQVELVASTALLSQVADKLKLASRSEFTQSTSLSIPFLTEPSQGTLEERVLRNMRERLKVYRTEGTRVIVIQFSSKDPKLAADVPNAIADAYMALQRKAKLETDTTATEWLKPEIDKLREGVKAAEARVADYRAANDIPVGQNNASLATQQLSEISTELSRVRASRAAAAARAQSIRSALETGGAVDAIPEVQTSSLIQRLIEKKVDLRAEIADLSTTLLDNHPRIRSLRSQLGQLDTQIRAEANKVLAGLKTEAETARLRERELIADVNRLKAEPARVSESEVELRALEREAAAQRDLLESYLVRFREAASRKEKAYSPVNARVFSRAIVPGDPYFPKKIPILGATFVGALLLMTVATLLGELVSGRAMRTVSAPPAPATEIAMPVVARAEPVPARVAAPPPETPVAAIVAEDPPEPAPRVQPRRQPGHDTFESAQAVEKAMSAADTRASMAAARKARETVRPAVRHPGLASDELASRLMAAGAGRAVFVSPEGDEGAAAAVLTARAMADAGLRIVVVDLTADAAASLPMLERNARPGITDLLAGTASFSEIIHGDLYSNCHVIPTGMGAPDRVARAIERLSIILDALAQVYDMIVIECGPTDAGGIERVCNATAEIVLSVVDPASPTVAAAVEDLVSAGYKNLLIGRADIANMPLPPRTGRSAA